MEAQRRPFDEMTLEGGATRQAYDRVAHWLRDAPNDFFATRRNHAELMFRRIGITFNVYGDKEATERLIPFDIIPRILQRSEWMVLEAGLVQRVKALNAFLADIYGAQEILRAGVVPRDLVENNPAFLKEMVGVPAPHGITVHIAGIDIVRTDSNDFYVLEDNARTPSGVSYMLENREVMMRVAPDLFADHRVAPVENYPDALLATLRSVDPSGSGDPTVALLTPGPFNSAYYEHSFLADKLGIELVEGRDLVVRDDTVYMRTTEGPKRVDVIYRRIDDAFLDPEAFNPESCLGVPGIMRAYRAGRVAIANGVGTGVADDKATYTYMPDIVRFYFGEELRLKNVQTWRCREADSCGYVLDNLKELVVKEVNGSGGYGMLVGPHATREQIDTFAGKIKADPSNYIAQPTLPLSTCPTYFDSGVAPRHVDLRPFVLTGADGVRVIPGGLTRVALTAGSLVVNSSQGGGTKDTWVIDDPAALQSAVGAGAAAGGLPPAQAGGALSGGAIVADGSLPLSGSAQAQS